MTAQQPASAPPAELPLVVRTLTQEKIERYGRATGDLNPVHVDPRAAAGTRFEGTIAHGMLVLAYISEAMTAAFGLDWLRNGRLRVKFRAVARPDDTVTAGGHLKSAQRADGFRRAVYAVEARNQQGEVLISGEAEADVPVEGR
ncbi:MAG: MaoC family dehydratase [Dehalococcoidia bacterium]